MELEKDCKCICGNSVTFNGQKCGQCEAEMLMESDGHGYRSGRYENKEAEDYANRLDEGFNMLHWNQ